MPVVITFTVIRSFLIELGQGGSTLALTASSEPGTHSHIKI